MKYPTIFIIYQSPEKELTSEIKETKTGVTVQYIKCNKLHTKITEIICNMPKDAKFFIWVCSDNYNPVILQCCLYEKGYLVEDNIISNAVFMLHKCYSEETPDLFLCKKGDHPITYATLEMAKDKYSDTTYLTHLSISLRNSLGKMLYN